MGDGIYAALSGAIAQNQALESTAQNLANASTSGYRSLRPVFREVLSQASVEGQPLRFSVVSGTEIDTTPGALRETGRSLDVALPEDRFLAVTTPAGERYTRAGALVVSPDGVLEAPGGYALLSETKREPIKVPPNAQITITEDGQVSIDGNPGERLRLVSFERPEMLLPEGASLFVGRPEAGEATVAPATLKLGTLEESNASPVKAMHELITTTRLFEAFERIIGAFHEADRKVVSTVAKT